MKHLLATALAMSLTATTSAAELQALLITGQTNEWHNPAIMDRVLTDYLEETGLFDVTLVRTPASAEDMSGFAPEFANYDVVILNYDGDDWPADTQQAFVDYMQTGGGLVSVHSSDNSFPDWREFNEMLGVGGWRGRDERWGPALRWVDGTIVRYEGPGAATHPDLHDYPVTIRDSNHPVTRGLPAEWLHAHDELYTGLRGPAINVRVLATGFANPAMENASGFHEPVLMALEYGAGRVFHTTLGHVPAAATDAPPSVRCIGFITTFQRGAEWAATGEVTQALPERFPDGTSTALRE
jgi:type 1 glutamine amidotransferase